MEAMPNSRLLLLGENITVVMSNWSFGIFGGFSWNRILACAVKYGSYFAKVCLLFWYLIFIGLSPLL